MPTAKRKPAKPAPIRDSRRSSSSKSSARKSPASRPGLAGGLLTRSSSRSPARKPAAKSAPRWSWHSLSAERKLDVLGVILALIGLLSLLSLMSSSQGSATGWLVNGFYQLAGWGAFVLPMGLILIGLWLVFRNVERLPLLSPERLVGLILLYTNLLTWLHLLFGGSGFEDVRRGGGLIGAFFKWIFVQTVDVAGAVVVLLAWLIIALAFALDLEIPQIIQLIQSFIARLRESREAASSNDTLNTPTSHPTFSPRPPEFSSPSSSLPPTFQPLETQPKPSRPQRAGERGSIPQPAANPNLNPAAVNASGGQSNPRLSEAPVPAAAPEPTTAPTAPIWLLPSIDDILDPPIPQAAQATAETERAHLIEETLASFGAPAHVVEISRGPTVTQFGVEPDFIENRSGRMRVRVGKIAALADDLALALAAPRIRIQAPVPGRSFVGIEVPNVEISRVSLREVIESDPFRKLRSPLRFAMGKDVAGRPSSYDLALMPHLLIAGTTGSGKSVCVNAILACFLLQNTPQELRLILVDPKRVELTGYNGVPHLLAPVVTDAERVIGALQWMMREMDARYHRFSKEGVRNIIEFNTRHPNEKLPYLVIVIDELADLMMLAPEETERTITRLAQLARATGIHLILATQRPSTDVVTGLIKANFPARVAFAVASNIDSRVILDQPGAERLLGRGDMLFQAPDASSPIRLQGVYVSDSEISRLVDYWRFTKPENFDQIQSAGQGMGAATGQLASGPADMMPSGIPLKQISFLEEEQDGDPLTKEAIDLVRREGRASITMLQRRMRIGYTRAARLIDAMEDKGIIGPSQPNSQVREILDYGPTAPPEDDGY